jgi:hypothetical protein
MKGAGMALTEAGSNTNAFKYTMAIHVVLGILIVAIIGGTVYHLATVKKLKSELTSGAGQYVAEIGQLKERVISLNKDLYAMGLDYANISRQRDELQLRFSNLTGRSDAQLQDMLKRILASHPEDTLGVPAGGYGGGN